MREAVATRTHGLATPVGINSTTGAAGLTFVHADLRHLRPEGLQRALTARAHIGREPRCLSMDRVQSPFPVSWHAGTPSSDVRRTMYATCGRTSVRAIRSRSLPLATSDRIP